MTIIMINGSLVGSSSESEASVCRVSINPHFGPVEGIGNDGQVSVGDVEDEVVISDDKENLSQGAVSLLDISASDTEDACKYMAHEAMQKTDTHFATWCNDQIQQGNDTVAMWDK